MMDTTMNVMIEYNNTMKKLLLLSVFAAQLASAQTFHDWDNPSKKFDLGNTTKTFNLIVKSTNWIPNKFTD